MTDPAGASDAPTPRSNRDDRLAAIIGRIDDLQRGLASVRTDLLARVVPLETRVLDLEQKFDRLIKLADHTDGRLRWLEARVIGGTGLVFVTVEALVALFNHLGK